jgi:hypothetical protein
MAEESEAINDSDAKANEAAVAVVADIKRAEGEILDLYLRFSRGPICYQHLYLFGIARRALAQSSAFRSMIDQRNSLVASSIIRMQLDTVLRLYALFWVADPEEFAKKVFKGTEINKLKASDGERMTDAYLRNRVAKTNDWIPAVYRETSGYIHFSNRHMKAALRSTDEENRLQLFIGPQDVGKPLSYYGEMLRAFRHLTMMIPVAAADCLSRLQNIRGDLGIGALSDEPSIVRGSDRSS